MGMGSGSGSGSTIAIALLGENLFFSGVPDDILVNILCRLDEDPRDLARLACVSMRFCNIIKTVCWKFRCEKSLPLLVAELLRPLSPALHPCPEPPGGWAALQKLHVCCPGLWHAGVLLENWDFGLDREIGWFDDLGYPDVLFPNERAFSKLGHSHIDESLGKESRDRYTTIEEIASTPSFTECGTNGSDVGIACSDVDDVVAHVSGDVCDEDAIGTRTHGYANEAGMDCDGKEAVMRGDGMEAGMDCDGKEAVMRVDGMEAGMDCDGKEAVMRVDGMEAGMDCDGKEAVMRGDGMEADLDQGELKKKGGERRPKHCLGFETTVSEIFDEGAVDVSKLMRDDEFDVGAIKRLANSHGLDASRIDGTNVVDKHGTQQICKPACAELWLSLLNSDASKHVSLETSCRQQSEEALHLADIQGSSGAVAQEKRKQVHRQKSNKRQRECRHGHCHVATGPWNLSREQGNKLLANRFRADSLYICDWPGCVHPGDRRMYKLFRGVFKNFKKSHVWRNLKDMNAKATNVGCAFCVCKSTWDMVTTFCLKRSIEYHDDGEPVVRAYVCENGHVAGAWTDRPMYTL